jgi:hypothetical protein
MRRSVQKERRKRVSKTRGTGVRRPPTRRRRTHAAEDEGRYAAREGGRPYGNAARWILSDSRSRRLPS